MTIRLALAAALFGALAVAPASAATMHHKHPVRHHVAKHRMTHATMMRHQASAAYGAPNRQPLSSGDSPTTPRQGRVDDPVSVPGSDAAIYNYSPDDHHSVYGY